MASKGHKKYRLLQNDLDEVGVHTCILRIGPKRFQLIVNYEVVKEFRKRSTCNSRLIKLHKKHIANEA